MSKLANGTSRQAGADEAKSAEQADGEAFKPHYSVKSTARRLRMSERRVRKAVEDGDLRSVKFGGRVVIPGSEVRRLVEQIN